MQHLGSLTVRYSAYWILNGPLTDGAGYGEEGPASGLEREFPVADPNAITRAQFGAGVDPFPAHPDAVRRSQIGDEDRPTVIGDDGVVAADLGVGQHDVVVGAATYPGGRAG